MTRGKHIRAVGGNAGKDAAPETGSESSPVADHSFDETMAEPMLDDEIVTPDDANGGDEYLQEPARWTWIAPTFAVMAVLGWTGFFGWAMQAQLLAPASLAPTEWVRLIIDWAIPVALIGMVWMIAMRNSRAEASRFAASAALLSQESQQLETRLTVVNRELSLAREFLASQSRELETLGRMASERISTHAGELQQLIHENGVQVDRIGSASETALSNMTLLRDDLPVVANSARDVNNQIANAGRSARENLDRLIVGFERLNEFGKASETQVAALGSNIGEMLGGYQAQLDQLDTLATERLVSLKQDAENYRLAIDANETVALSAMRDRIAALQDDAAAMAQKLKQAEQEASAGISEAIMALQNRLQDMIATIESLDRKAAASSQDRISKLHAEAGRFDAALAQRDAKFLEEMERRQAEFETRETQASELLSQRLSQLDEALAERREAQLAETAKLVEYSRAMSEELGSFNSLIAQIGESSESARTSLSEGISSLESQLNLKRNALAETQEQLMQVTDASVRLLEIIQSGARQSREDLPQAISTAADALSSIEERSTALNTMMLGTKTHGEELGQYLIRTKAEIEAADSSIDALHTKLNAQAEDTMAKLQGLRGRLGQLSEETGSFAGDAQEQLQEALERLEQATQRSFAALDTGAREKVRALAEDLSDEALKALERGLRNETAETIGALEQAASHAAGVGREATVQLRDQLAMVNELTGNLEQRITRARELAEEQVNNDFARRMALLTDSLNSSAIDITGALSTEVTDTAWDAYLKGDRGIFTRRAVRLIDNGGAREIAELYQSDEAFKVNVSRYIHDFEAMLRSILSTRDGKALSVTLLGSDMGKLYVLLAQSIERFRN